MDIIDIKKQLYKNKPLARIQGVNKTGILYMAAWGGDAETSTDDNVAYFKVPLDDLGDATFGHIMEAQLLIRYLI